VIQASARKKAFFTLQDFFSIFSQKNTLVFSLVFLAIFSLSFSALFSFVSRKRQFFFPSSSFDQFGVFKQKLKLMPPPLSLHKQLLTLMNAQKVEQYYIIVSSSHEAAICVCV